MRQMSPIGYTFLENEEGLRLQAYDDATGHPPHGRVIGKLTIGWGHTGPDVFAGQTITREEAERLFDKDTDWAEECVEKTCPKLNNNQFDALVSLCYNIGASSFRGSSVARMWNAGDAKAAGRAIGMWVKSTSNPRGVLEDHPTLIARRAREMAMFFTPVLDAGPATMPQSVENPGKTTASKPMWTNVAVGTGAATLAASNITPALEAINAAVDAAKSAQTTFAKVDDLLSPIWNGHVYTMMIAGAIALAAIYLAHRIWRRIRRGEIVP